LLQPISGEKEKAMNLRLLEIIFHRKELKELRERFQEYEHKDILVLSLSEKILILDALRDPHYIEKVQNPKTKYFIRQSYKNLVLKIAKKTG
jgi:hypothetical protein